MIIAAFNPKGGVGKTTTAVNLAAILAKSRRSVLLIDLEADHNASISLGVRHPDLAPSIGDLLVRQKRADAAVRPVPEVPGLHLITGAPALADMDAALRNVRQPERRLADIVRPLAARFDVIIIDAPSGFSRVSEGVTMAADHLI